MQKEFVALLQEKKFLLQRNKTKNTREDIDVCTLVD
jgi:hypothetical protein